jgi:transcriptional regulator with XRE-family HTH domain
MAVTEGEAHVGETIRRLREARGLTQAALAKAIGVDAQSVSRWERAERVPNAMDYRKAMDVLENILPIGLGQTVSRGTGPSEAEAPLPPSHAKLIRDFEREAARMGATDPELDHIHWSLRNPQSSRMFYMGDDGKPMTADEQLEELGFQVHGLRVWLQARLDKRAPKGKKLR